MSSRQDLFHQQMDRKEFLTYIGILLLAITGISGILKNLSNLNVLNLKKQDKKDVLNLKQTKPITSGFGSGTYGA
jgi:TRAP-type mannitol/chloroaromatic compound transport system permease small subunit